MAKIDLSEPFVEVSGSVINAMMAKRVLAVVDKGLVFGLGKPKPGQMCVEAAVAYAYGEDHNDHPDCVDGGLASAKIGLNDYRSWGSKKARANGLRRLAIAQLGSGSMKGGFDRNIFNEKLEVEMNKILLPLLKQKFLKKVTASLQDVRDANSINDIKNWVPPTCRLSPAGRSPSIWVDFMMVELGVKGLIALNLVCEACVQALKEMKVPGTKYLYLTKTPTFKLPKIK